MLVKLGICSPIFGVKIQKIIWDHHIDLHCLIKNRTIIYIYIHMPRKMNISKSSLTSPFKRGNHFFLREKTSIFQPFGLPSSLSHSTSAFERGGGVPWGKHIPEEFPPWVFLFKGFITRGWCVENPWVFYGNFFIHGWNHKMDGWNLLRDLLQGDDFAHRAPGKMGPQTSQSPKLWKEFLNINCWWNIRGTFQGDVGEILEKGMVVGNIIYPLVN